MHKLDEINTRNIRSSKGYPFEVKLPLMQFVMKNGTKIHICKYDISNKKQHTAYCTQTFLDNQMSGPSIIIKHNYKTCSWNISTLSSKT